MILKAKESFDKDIDEIKIILSELEKCRRNDDYIDKSLYFNPKDLNSFSTNSIFWD